MTTIGAFEAKTHFSQLLARVVGGETIIITKHGESIAKIIPMAEEKKQNSAVEAIKAIRNLRKGVTLGKKLSLKQLIKEGRKSE
ncbi:MAG TPA: type II toxin-antitoxin system prevent-host-death family antitoxin [Gammaproteobacteria bacterium]|nr:type II toxin-antitoxin system prevent-host-death family antitoxin [Gammaproteobacteria bacterium]